jgi:hypothetical protein
MSDGILLKIQLFAKARELAGGKATLEIRSHHKLNEISLKMTDVILIY